RVVVVLAPAHGRCDSGAGGGGRTLTRGEPNGILSPARLPVSPLRHFVSGVGGYSIWALGDSAQHAFARRPRAQSVACRNRNQPGASATKPFCLASSSELRTGCCGLSE